MALGLEKAGGVFRDVSVPAPRYTCYEAGFLRNLSWLYILYQEAGKVNVSFLLEKFRFYELDHTRSQQHVRTVHNLRTYLQHSLSLMENHDQSIQARGIGWFHEVIDLSAPTRPSHWQACLNALLQEAEAFMRSIVICIGYIGSDEFCAQIVEEWSNRCSSYHPPEEFDRLISLVAADIGMHQINPVVVRRKHFDQWTKRLALYRTGYDFDVEARKLIESALISNPILPITSDDLMREFGLSPGVELGDKLRQAHEIYKDNRCDASTLIEILRHSTSTAIPAVKSCQ